MARQSATSPDRARHVTSEMRSIAPHIETVDMDEKKIDILDLLNFEPRQCAGLFLKKLATIQKN